MKIELSESSKEFVNFLEKKYKISKSEILDSLVTVAYVAYLQNPDALDKGYPKSKKGSKESKEKIRNKRTMNTFDYHSMYNNFSGHSNLEEGC
jgi:hypothetical protein